LSFKFTWTGPGVVVEKLNIKEWNIICFCLQRFTIPWYYGSEQQMSAYLWPVGQTWQFDIYQKVSSWCKYGYMPFVVLVTHLLQHSETLKLWTPFKPTHCFQNIEDFVYYWEFLISFNQIGHIYFIRFDFNVYLCLLICICQDFVKMNV